MTFGRGILLIDDKRISNLLMIKSDLSVLQVRFESLTQNHDDLPYCH